MYVRMCVGLLLMEFFGREENKGWVCCGRFGGHVMVNA